MSDVIYDKSSPYYKTPLFAGKFLDITTLPTITYEPDDVLFQINKTYQNRPDLLANDLYGDSGLWWVFAVRNPNVIQDPVFDMRVGKSIYIPKKEAILSALGT